MGAGRGHKSTAFDIGTISIDSAVKPGSDLFLLVRILLLRNGATGRGGNSVDLSQLFLGALNVCRVASYVKKVLNVAGCFLVIGLLYENDAEQIFQLGKLMVLINLHPLAGRLFRGCEIMQMIIGQRVAKPGIGKAYRIQSQHLVRDFHNFLPLLLLGLHLRQTTVGIRILRIRRD